MVSGANTSIKAVFRADFAELALAVFALLASIVASGSVFFNDVYFWGQSHHYINPYLFLIAVLLGFSQGRWGLMGCIFLLPLSAGLGNQLNAYLGTNFLVLPNAGLDLAAGFFLGSLIGVSPKVISIFKARRDEPCNLEVIRQLVPWPVALVMVMISISTAIAIARNVYQSAAATSFKGLLFNLVHFRPIGWHDDYMPISDWVAYALAVAMIVLVIGYLKDKQNKNQIIFRPIIAGLIIAALMGIAQAITGLGLPESLLSFRKDQFGYAVIGFQPDLHAFAGHMLLGAVGLWGYFYSGISKLERKVILFAVALSWVGLILSKSRALLLIALVAMFIWMIWYLWKKKRHFFLPTIAIAVAAISIVGALISNYSTSLSGIPVLSWLGELANEFKSRDLTSWSLFSGIFGSRFEIWEAALRMWWEFPLMGIGQGNFYRLSDIASFSKSHFLILNHGENAHNYFLQTLTETGVIGVAVFSLALLAPFFSVKNRGALIPAVTAILSLFLANIFSHSFLVRENILIFSVFFGCFYAYGVYFKEVNSQSILEQINWHPIISLIFFLLLICSLGAYEVARSFGAYPFKRGFYCFISYEKYDDGWSSGAWEIVLPLHSQYMKMKIQNAGHSKTSLDLMVTVEGEKGVIIKPTIQVTRVENDNDQMEIYLSKLDWDRLGLQANLRINTLTCLTPRNLAISLDGRRLGLRVIGISVDGKSIK